MYVCFCFFSFVHFFFLSFFHFLLSFSQLRTHRLSISFGKNVRSNATWLKNYIPYGTVACRALPYCVCASTIANISWRNMLLRKKNSEDNIYILLGHLCTPRDTRSCLPIRRPDRWRNTKLQFWLVGLEYDVMMDAFLDGGSPTSDMTSRWAQARKCFLAFWLAGVDGLLFPDWWTGTESKWRNF